MQAEAISEAAWEEKLRVFNPFEELFLKRMETIKQEKQEAYEDIPEEKMPPVPKMRLKKSTARGGISIEFN